MWGMGSGAWSGADFLQALPPCRPLLKPCVGSVLVLENIWCSGQNQIRFGFETARGGVGVTANVLHGPTVRTPEEHTGSGQRLPLKTLGKITLELPRFLPVSFRLPRFLQCWRLSVSSGAAGEGRGQLSEASLYRNNSYLSTGAVCGAGRCSGPTLLNGPSSHLENGR